MEISNALLVAIMFVMLLSIGIANILAALATLVDKRAALKMYSLHVAWTVLLLLVYMNLFWHTVILLQVDDWEFHGFLYVIAGPTILLFASSILLAAPEDEEDPKERYLAVSPQFFGFLGLMQAWVLGADVLLGQGLTQMSIANVVLGVLALMLVRSKNLTVHKMVTIVAWVVVVSVAGLRGVGVLQ